MRQTREPCLLRNLRDVQICLHEQTLRVHDAGLLDVLDDRAAGSFAEFPAHIVFADVEMGRERRERERIGIIRVNICHDLLHTVFVLGRTFLVARPQNLEKQEIQQGAKIRVMVFFGIILLFQHVENRTADPVQQVRIRPV